MRFPLLFVLRLGILLYYLLNYLRVFYERKTNLYFAGRTIVK